MGTQEASKAGAVKKKPPPVKDDRQFQRTNLTSVPDLPGLPRYTGSLKFQYGVSCPGLKGGPTYTVAFLCQEDQQTVVVWYEGALSGGGWKISKTPSSISAVNKSGTSCSINVQPAASYDKPYRSKVMVVYRSFN